MPGRCVDPVPGWDRGGNPGGDIAGNGEPSAASKAHAGRDGKGGGKMIVALYARVSTVRQAEMDLSIPDQVRQIKEWCAKQGHSVAAEYIESGASATDDRRPAFQQMIAEACGDPTPFEAVLVHSLSRFFRDSYEFAFYERKLSKAGVKLISITQQTGDDPAGEMARKIFSLFDEYQSKENGKHTLRAMV